MGRAGFLVSVYKSYDCFLVVRMVLLLTLCKCSGSASEHCLSVQLEGGERTESSRKGGGDFRRVSGLLVGRDFSSLISVRARSGICMSHTVNECRLKSRLLRET